MIRLVISWRRSSLCVWMALVCLHVGILDAERVFAEDSSSSGILAANELGIESLLDQPYRYKMGSRRDPFVPLRSSGSEEDPEISGISKTENSEDPLTLLGVIFGARGYQALVKFPNGERVVVEPGSYLEGIRGTVRRITRDSVVIARPLDANGDAQLSENSLVLSP
ncbi:hypothetical protein [Candidatus Nitronereus thalassa]|uniref:Pilus assembly protein, PilP n=1 Tax=Candidatus Nitronereus thalassa TaxID=3020898 RepID=A0ABU3KBK5_9BACT|nr:hypothetical protein [Candidatus Nitronereus thalassa]MDT7043819.1 hypothetical protein [Candidatus Nitronereus thalassa]